MLLRNSNLIADDINATPSGSIIEPNLNILQINVSPSNSDVSLHDEIVGITKEDVNNEMSINIDLNERIGDRPIVECFDEIYSIFKDLSNKIIYSVNGYELLLNQVLFRFINEHIKTYNSIVRLIGVFRKTINISASDYAKKCSMKLIKMFMILK